MTEADRPRLLELNDESVQMLSELDEQRLEFILELAQRSLVAELDGEIAGFAIAIAQGTGYDSDNYRWFSHRYERFLYLDRIAVDAARRRHGVGGALYDAMEATAAASGRMVCEVNVEPLNEVSLAFHARPRLSRGGPPRARDGPHRGAAEQGASGLRGLLSAATGPSTGTPACARGGDCRAARSGGPASTTTPRVHEHDLSATSRAKPISCVTTIIVMPVPGQLLHGLRARRRRAPGRAPRSARRTASAWAPSRAPARSRPAAAARRRAAPG